MLEKYIFPGKSCYMYADRQKRQSFEKLFFRLLIRNIMSKTSFILH